MARIEVFVDDNFHYMQEDERYTLGAFDTREEALAACMKIVDNFLLSAWKPGMTADALYEQYIWFGEDPWFDGSHPEYSSWDYARQRSTEICTYGMRPSGKG